MFPIIEDPKRKDSIGDYIGYLDRTRRTTGESRYETHLRKLSKETASYYGLTNVEYDTLTVTLKKEEDKNENTGN